MQPTNAIAGAISEESKPERGAATGKTPSASLATDRYSWRSETIDWNTSGSSHGTSDEYSRSQGLSGSRIHSRGNDAIVRSTPSCMSVGNVCGTLVAGFFCHCFLRGLRIGNG